MSSGTSSAASTFLAAFRAGRVCLHPTDTLLGLTFDPRQPAAHAALTRLKGRPEDKPCLGLVPSLATARRFFAPLPGAWDAALSRVWPGPLSVVWLASNAAPATLVAADGTIGLRVPALPSEADWFAAVLAVAETPLPTTSVNRAGQPALTTVAAVRAAWPGAAELHIPPIAAAAAAGTTAGRPSTIIRLLADGSFTMLREGAVTSADLHRLIATPASAVGPASTPVTRT